MVIETKAVVFWEMGGSQDRLERGRRMSEIFGVIEKF